MESSGHSRRSGRNNSYSLKQQRQVDQANNSKKAIIERVRKVSTNKNGGSHSLSTNATELNNTDTASARKSTRQYVEQYEWLLLEKQKRTKQIPRKKGQLHRRSSSQGPSKHSELETVNDSQYKDVKTNKSQAIVQEGHYRQSRSTQSNSTSNRGRSKSTSAVKNIPKSEHQIPVASNELLSLRKHSSISNNSKRLLRQVSYSEECTAKTSTSLEKEGNDELWLRRQDITIADHSVFTPRRERRNSAEVTDRQKPGLGAKKLVKSLSFDFEHRVDKYEKERIGHRSNKMNSAPNDIQDALRFFNGELQQMSNAINNEQDKNNNTSRVVPDESYYSSKSAVSHADTDNNNSANHCKTVEGNNQVVDCSDKRQELKHEANADPKSLSLNHSGCVMPGMETDSVDKRCRGTQASEPSDNSYTDRAKTNDEIKKYVEYILELAFQELKSKELSTSDGQSITSNNEMSNIMTDSVIASATPSPPCEQDVQLISRDGVTELSGRKATSEIKCDQPDEVNTDCAVTKTDESDCSHKLPVSSVANNQLNSSIGQSVNNEILKDSSQISVCGRNRPKTIDDYHPLTMHSCNTSLANCCANSSNCCSHHTKSANDPMQIEYHVCTTEELVPLVNTLPGICNHDKQDDDNHLRKDLLASPATAGDNSQSTMAYVSVSDDSVFDVDISHTSEQEVFEHKEYESSPVVLPPPLDFADSSCKSSLQNCAQQLNATYSNSETSAYDTSNSDIRVQRNELTSLIIGDDLVMSNHAKDKSGKANDYRQHVLLSEVDYSSPVIQLTSSTDSINEFPSHSMQKKIEPSRITKPKHCQHKDVSTDQSSDSDSYILDAMEYKIAEASRSNSSCRSDSETTSLDFGETSSIDSQSPTAHKKRVTIATGEHIPARHHGDRKHQKGILKKPSSTSNPLYGVVVRDQNSNNITVIPSHSSTTSPIDRVALSHQLDTTDLGSDTRDNRPPLRRSFSASNVNSKTLWYVPPPVSDSGSPLHPRVLHLRASHAKLKSASLDFIAESAFEPSFTFGDKSKDGRRHSMTRDYKVIDSLRKYGKLSLPKLSNIFLRRSSQTPPLVENDESEVITLETLYSEWLKGPAKNQCVDGGHETVRIVVLSKTKKGYGFVLRGAKAEQLKKLNRPFVPSDQMPGLQYLDSVEPSSVAFKAGLRQGDFLIEIDGKNVQTLSHEQTVQIIKKSGELLQMKVVRPLMESNHVQGGYMDGTQTLPNRRNKKILHNHDGKPSTLKNGGENIKSSNGTLTDEAQALEHLDQTLANYDSESQSSSSSHVNMREHKVASIRQRPSSSHFNSIQELDDMFNEPPKEIVDMTPTIVSANDKNNKGRKPAKSKAKKFWSRSRNKLSESKAKSLSQPNLAALGSSEAVRPITMYEMALGHSINDNSIPRTESGDINILRQNSVDVPPPPMYPAPTAPEAQNKSSVSDHRNTSNTESSFKPDVEKEDSATESGTRAQLTHSTSTSAGCLEKRQFLPRTPLPVESDPSLSGCATLPRNHKISPPPPPLRTSSHESSVLLAVQQGQRSRASSQSSSNILPSPDSQSDQLDTSQGPPSLGFADAIKKAAENRNTKASVKNNNPTIPVSNGITVGDELYSVVQKRQNDVNGHLNQTSDIEKKVQANKTRSGPLSVEDQIRLAVAKRRTAIEARESTEATDSDRSNTPERVLASPPPSKADSSSQHILVNINSSTSKIKATHTSTESPNFRQLAEQKRQEWIKKKASSSDLIPVQSLTSNETQQQKQQPQKQQQQLQQEQQQQSNSTEKNLTELQQIMNRLSVNSAEENNNKKKVPPAILKKPAKPDLKQSQEIHALSPVEEFPPPPPPDDFNTSADIIIPPPNFEPSFSPPPAPYIVNSSSRHDPDNHSVSSSVGSDNVSSVSQDNNRLSVATSGYSSDPNRAGKVSASEKPVENWSSNEVAEWLDSIGLGEYKQVFIDNCIEGDTLVSMTKDDIKELGVEKVGHRVKLDKEIRRLIGESRV